VTVTRKRIAECESDILQGQVDIALVSTLSVLRNPSDYWIVPGLGLASQGSFPNARLVLNGALDQVRRIGVDGYDEQAAELARLLVSEQYGQQAEIVELAEIESDLAEDPVDAWLITDPDHGSDHEKKITLDLGTEWYELTTRPMLWGLLATASESLHPGEYGLLVGASSPSGHEDDYVHVDTDAFGSCYSRLDEFTLQGLEAFVDYLFWTNRIAEVPDIQFAAVPELPDH
jgi:hypothetical protein